jgi:Uma2 family endonuclease
MLPQQTKRRRFDVDQYHQMLEAGILTEDNRVELIDGEIVEMTPVGGRHVRSVNRLNKILAPAAARAGLLVSIQNPLVLDDYREPEPDVALILDELETDGGSEGEETEDRDADAGADAEVPSASEALLVIEVSESSLSWDKNVKIPRYARAAIPEAWVLDLASGVLEVYTEPEPSGAQAHYREVKTLQGEEELSVGALGDLGARVKDIL